MTAAKIIILGVLFFVVTIAFCIWVIRFCNRSLSQTEEYSAEYNACCLGIAVAAGILLWDVYMILELASQFYRM
jgi:hypothetical protein